MVKKAEDAYFDDRALPTDAALKTISRLADQQVKLEDELAQLEEAVKRKKEQLRSVSEVALPEAMKAAGMATVSTTQGYSIKVETEYYASLTGKYRAPAIAWLRKNKLDALINRIIMVPFGKGEDNKANKLLAIIKKEVGETNTIKDIEEVNTGSFKAAVREQLSKGRAVPLAEIGVNEVNRANITRANQGE